MSSSTPKIHPLLVKISQQWSTCADCDASDPDWAELNRGTFICLQCSGVHRSFGTHVSKVRSSTLDEWTKSMAGAMQASNIEFNKVYEYHVPEAYRKPTIHTNRANREKYLQAKYIGLESYSVSGKLIPAFHQQQWLKSPSLPPVFDEYCKDDEKSAGVNNDAKDQGMKATTGVIIIHCVSAANLPTADLLSPSDPYVKVHNNVNGQSVTSRAIQDNNDPVFNETLQPLTIDEEQAISIEIYDEDTMSADDLLCTHTVHIGKECEPGKQTELKLEMQLEPQYMYSCKFKKKKNKTPTLVLNITYTKLA